MLAVRLNADLEERLNELAARTGRTKTWYARRAIEEYIDELEAIALVEMALHDPDAGNRVTLEQMRRELGLDD